MARVDDPTRVDHGDAHLLLDARRQRRVHAGRRVGEGHELLVIARGLAGRAGDREVVELAQRVQGADDLDHVVQVEPVGDQLVAADPHPDDEVASDRGADGSDDLDREAKAVLEAATVLVGPAVHRRHPELVDEVAGEGREVGTVEARTLEAPCRGGVRLDDLGDLGAVERVGDLPVLRLGDIRGRDQGLLARPGEAAAAPVGDLRHDVGALGVDRARERLERRERRVVPVLDPVPVHHGARRVDARAPEALDEAGAASRLLRVVADVALGDVAVLAEPGRVRRAHDPVPERDVPEPEGCEEMLEGHLRLLVRRRPRARAGPSARRGRDRPARSP